MIIIHLNTAIFRRYMIFILYIHIYIYAYHFHDFTIISSTQKKSPTFPLSEEDVPPMVSQRCTAGHIKLPLK